MDTKKIKTLKITAILFIIAAICSLATTVIVIGEPDVNMYILLLVSLVALGSALFYIVSGFRKQDANKYKCFLISYSVSLLMSIIASAKISEYYPVVGTLGIIAFALNFGAVMVLGVSKDLGKETAMSFVKQCLVNVAIMSIITLVLIPGIFNNTDVIASVYYYGLSRHVSLAFVLYTCTTAKYMDKDSRGTK